MPTAPAATADPPRNLPIAKQPETSKAVAGPAEEPITDPGDFTDQLATTLAGLIYRKTNAKEKRAELTDGVKIHRNLRRADISAEALAGEQRRVLKVMTATGLSIDKLKTLTVKIGQEPGYRSFPNAVVVSMPKTGHRTAAKAAYRQGLARRWLEQLARQNETAFKGLREDIDEPYREGKRALMSDYWRSGHKGRFMGALYLTATGQMPEWWRKNVRPEGLGLIDHAGSKGWKDDTVKIAGQIIGQGRAKTLSKYEREWRKAASNLRTKERTWREMTLADRFTSRRKKAYREMRKAQARVRATKAMTKKARAVSFWMFGQRPNGKAAPWVKLKNSLQIKQLLCAAINKIRLHAKRIALIPINQPNIAKMIGVHTDGFVIDRQVFCESSLRREARVRVLCVTYEVGIQDFSERFHFLRR